MKAPAGIPAREARVIERSVASSLHGSFRIVCLISGALALLASVCALWGVRNVRHEKSSS